MNNAAFSQEARLDAFRKANNIKKYEDEVQAYFNANKFYSLYEAKKWNRSLGHSIARLFPDDQKRINRVFSCGSQTSIVYSPSLHKSHIESFWCDERCCPVCNYYKSRSLFSRVYNYVRENSDKNYVFLTLTVPNVPMSELRDTVKRMNRAFGRMFRIQDKKSKTFPMFSGYIRRLEVTYNIDSDSKSYRTFHPHLHVLLECKPEYKPHSKCFYHTSEIVKDWRYYMEDESISEKAQKIKRIRPLGSYDSEDQYRAALADRVAEVAKYPMKFNKKLVHPDFEFLFDEYVAGMFTLKGCIFETVSQNFKHILHFVSKPQEGDSVEDVTSAPDAVCVGMYYSTRENKYIFTNIYRLDYYDKFGYSALQRFHAWFECMRAWDHGLLDHFPVFK